MQAEHELQVDSGGLALLDGSLFLYWQTYTTVGLSQRLVASVTIYLFPTWESEAFISVTRQGAAAGAIYETLYRLKGHQIEGNKIKEALEMAYNGEFSNNRWQIWNELVSSAFGISADELEEVLTYAIATTSNSLASSDYEEKMVARLRLQKYLKEVLS